MSNTVEVNEKQNKRKLIFLRVKYNKISSRGVNFVIGLDPGILDETLISKKILDKLIGYFFPNSKIKRKTLYTFINYIKLEARIQNTKTGEIIKDPKDSEYLELYNFCESWKENYIKRYGNIFN